MLFGQKRMYPENNSGKECWPYLIGRVNPACGHKEVRRPTGHIMVTTRYSDQQGSKSRQKIVRLYKQWHRPISKQSIKPPYSISRVILLASFSSMCPLLRLTVRRFPAPRTGHSGPARTRGTSSPRTPPTPPKSETLASLVGGGDV